MYYQLVILVLPKHKHKRGQVRELRQRSMRSEPSLLYCCFLSGEIQLQSPRCLQMFIPFHFWSLASFLYVYLCQYICL